ncbi:MAG: DUF998 domain-containing protein, partial [Thermoplasmata archaeon]
MLGTGGTIGREARLGGALLFLAALQFVGAMVLVQLEYPGYSDWANYVSDLGNPVHSPGAALFNGSIELLGLLTIVSAVLLRGAFARGPSGRLGRLTLALAALFALLVGLFPENSTALGGHLHGIVSDGTFLFSGLALLLLGVAMLGDPRWPVYGFYTLLSGIVTFLAIELVVV